METPLSAATSIQEMVLQNRGNKIRVFPAVPDDWPDAAFKDLRTEGAFLISAIRKNKETKWVSVKADADGICSIQPGITGVVIIRSTSAAIPSNDGNGSYQIAMKKGEEILLYADDSEPQVTQDQVKWNEAVLNPFGKKKE